MPAADIDLLERFRSLHHREQPLLLANAWDRGSARLLAALGFQALATTSAGFANALGRHDGELTRDEALEHAADLAASTPLPLNADLENGFGDTPENVATTASGAVAAGVAGFSIED